MRYLLDTQILLWYFNGDKRLPQDFVDVISNADNEVFVSIVSYWEIAIKASIGKLKLNYTVSKLEKMAQVHDFQTLGMSVHALDYLRDLDMDHQDPFDRYLLSQSRVENLEFITEDHRLKQYLDSSG